MECQLDHNNWDGDWTGVKLVPIMTDQVPTPEERLCIFRLDAIVKLLHAHTEITV